MHDFPLVPVGISEAIVIHPAMVLAFAVARSTVFKCFFHYLVYSLPAFYFNRNQYLGAFSGMNRFVRESGKTWPCYEHGIQEILPQNQAAGLFVAELFVETESQFRPKPAGLFQICNGKIDV